MSLNSLCVQIHTHLNTPPLLRGFGRAAQDRRETGRSSGQMEGDHASSVLARFLSIGINNLLTTVYKRVALAQGWNKGSVM